MATQSFYEDMIIDTPEAVRNLERAIELAEKRGPLKIVGAQGVEYDPVIIEKALARARAEKARQKAHTKTDSKKMTLED